MEVFRRMKKRISRIIEAYAGQGIHRTGSEVDAASAHWLAEEIERLGATPELESFAFERLEIDAAFVEIGDLVIDGVPFYYCTYTDPVGIEGTLGELGSKADIGVIMAPPSENDPAQLDIMNARTLHQHKAIVSVTDETKPGTGIALVNAEQFREPFGPPVLQVSRQHWNEIRSAISAGTSARLVASAHRVESTGINVGTTVDGAEEYLAPLVVMTPRSGWWQSASERGGGIAAFLEILKSVQENQPDRDVIFTANTGHELGHIGLDYFLDANSSLINDALCWIHLGANFAAQQSKIMMQYSDVHIATLGHLHLGQHRLAPDIEVSADNRPFGEARNIFDRGGHYLSLLGSNPLFHHPDDQWPKAVDIERTTAWVNWITDCVNQLGRH
jgi:hypothetical protein